MGRGRIFLEIQREGHFLEKLEGKPMDQEGRAKRGYHNGMKNGGWGKSISATTGKEAL